jgi:uncharacterized protein (TIGR02145 family)
MPTQVLTIEQINNYCLEILNADYPYYEELREAFWVLYLTGCRVEELFDITSWTYIVGYECTVLPLKGNNVRNVTLDSHCDNFIAAIQGQYAPFLGRHANMLTYLFNKVRTFGQNYSGSKPITLYIFRYRFEKTLYAEGATIEEISNIMGYLSSETSSNYIAAVITEEYTQPTVPVVVIGSQTWKIQNETIVDLGGESYSYNNDPTNDVTYGKLYTYEGAIRSASTVSGFRLPTLDDILQLQSTLGELAGGKMKEIGTEHWSSPNNYATNETGYTARGSGMRLLDSSYANLGVEYNNWTLNDYGSKAGIFRLRYDSGALDSGSLRKGYGLSMRLIKI